MENIKILELMKKAEKNGGLTIKPNGDEFTAKKGYMVSIINKEKTAESLEGFIELINQYEVDAEKMHGFIGLWKDSGKWYIDISYYILDRTDALEFGYKNKQVAIYGFKEEKSLYIKDYNFTSYYSLYKVLRDNDYNITNIINIGGAEKREVLKKKMGWSMENLKKHTKKEIPTNKYKYDYLVIKDYFLKVWG